MNTSLRGAVMGIDENINSDWTGEGMDSVIVCAHECRERERESVFVCVWLRVAFQWFSIITVSLVRQIHDNSGILLFVPVAPTATHEFINTNFSKSLQLILLQQFPCDQLFVLNGLICIPSWQKLLI